MLTVVLWTDTARWYMTYCSHVLDQSTLFALTCVHDALGRCPELVASCDRQVVWSDCGGHFRSCRFLYDTLINSLSTRANLRTSEIHFFAEGHGKGPVDAHFGRMSQCCRHVCRERTRARLSHVSLCTCVA